MEWERERVEYLFLLYERLRAPPSKPLARPSTGVGAAVSTQAPLAPQGLAMEEVSNGWVVAPDFKVTHVDASKAEQVAA